MRVVGLQEGCAISIQQFALLCTDTKQLYHVGLKQSNSEWEIDAHDPELGRTQKVAIRRICKQDLDQVNMQETGGCNGKRQIPHLERWETLVVDEPSYASIEDHGPTDSERCVELTQVIPIDLGSPIAAEWIEHVVNRLELEHC